MELHCIRQNALKCSHLSRSKCYTKHASEGNYLKLATSFFGGSSMTYIPVFGKLRNFGDFFRK